MTDTVPAGAITAAAAAVHELTCLFCSEPSLRAEPPCGRQPAEADQAAARQVLEAAAPHLAAARVQPAERDAIMRDLAQLLDALGLGSHAAVTRAITALDALDDANRQPIATVDAISGQIDHDDRAVTEHATQMSGGGMHVRYQDPEIERIYPLAEWIAHNQRFGGTVWGRTIIVIDDWAEVPKP